MRFLPTCFLFNAIALSANAIYYRPAGYVPGASLQRRQNSFSTVTNVGTDDAATAIASGNVGSNSATGVDVPSSAPMNSAPTSSVLPSSIPADSAPTSSILPTSAATSLAPVSSALASTGSVSTGSANTALQGATKYVVVGAWDNIVVYQYNGVNFTAKPSTSSPKLGRTSWLAFKKPNLLYANTQDGEKIRLYNYDPTSGDLSTQVASFDAPKGVVHLAWNKDQTILLASSYDQGTFAIYDATKPDGTLTLLRTQFLPDGVDKHQLRQAVLDPTGKFFIINDSLKDKLWIIDTEKDYTIIGSTPVTPAGSGPKRGVFVTIDGGINNPNSTYYVVTCEKAHTVQLFQVNYATDGTLALNAIQTEPASGKTSGISAGEAGHIAAIGTKIYVANSHAAGNSTDYLSIFNLRRAPDGTMALAFDDWADSGAVNPRHFSVSEDGSTMLIANQEGLYGVVGYPLQGAATRVYGTFNVDNVSKESGPRFIAEFK